MRASAHGQAAGIRTRQLRLSQKGWQWDDFHMGEQENYQPAAPSSAASDDRGDPTTQQMRTIGQRRRESERKLDLHMEEARHKGELSAIEGEDHSEG
jgi:hypothetical protein